MTTIMQCNRSSVREDVAIYLSTCGSNRVGRSFRKVAKVIALGQNRARMLGSEIRGMNKLDEKTYLACSDSIKRTGLKRHQAQTKFKGAVVRNFLLIGTSESPKGQVQVLRTKESRLLLSNTMPFLPSQQKVLINS
jgi:hypothetical protein